MIRMVDHQQPHIHFESCTLCHGVFFDAGEFRDYKEVTVAEWFKRR
jgi:Zn-finger nucleic acid-binding protein